MKRALGLLLKFTVTAAIFVAIFLEFGGGWKPVDTAQLSTPGAFAVSNPAYPGLIGRLRARLTGAPLPPPTVPSSIDDVCRVADRALFVRLADGSMRRFRPLRHCHDGALATVYVSSADGFTAVPLRDA